MRTTKKYIGTLVGLLGLALAGCGGGGGGSSPSGGSSGTVTTGVSDPARECTAPNGPYEHVYVTISDVQANISSSSNSGFTDLTPNLTSASPPKAVQVDLLATATPSADCLLSQLGQTSGLPVGKYQQIRVILVPNSTSSSSFDLLGPDGKPTSNQCATVSGFNCVVDSSGTAHLLSLPSEANTGIKIPSGQINNGGIQISSGQGLDIDIDFNACQSVVKAGNSGRYNLKPVLHASELGTSPVVAGTIVVGTLSGSSVTVPSASPSPVPNASVWLEQQAQTMPVQSTASPSPTPYMVENLIQTAITDANGHFEFCPVGASSKPYDIVADAATMPGGGASDVTIATGINVTSSGGPNNLIIPLVAEPSASPSPASVQGMVTISSSSSSDPSADDDVAVNGLQAFTPPGGTSQVWALVPYFPAASPAPSPGATPSPGFTDPVPPVVTPTTDGTGTNGPDCSAIGQSCPSGTDCACYQLGVPASNPVVGTANSTGSGYTIASSSSPMGAVAGLATETDTSLPECAPNPVASMPFALTAGGVATAPTLNFNDCDTSSP